MSGATRPPVTPPRQRMLITAALSVAAVSVALLAIDLTLVWNGGAPAEDGGPLAATLWAMPSAGALVVGLLIAGRRPGHLYGWLLLSMAVAGAAMETLGSVAAFALDAGRAPAHWGYRAAVAEDAVWPLMIAHIPLMLLFFPDGRLPSPRWRPLPLVIVSAAVVAGGLATWAPGELEAVAVENPYAAGGGLGTAVAAIVTGSAIIVLLSVVPAAVSLAGRRRSASAQERLQLRWFTAAAALLTVCLMAVSIAGPLFTDLASAAVLTPALLSVFAAIGIAVLRYRLYEIDRLVSRTVTYGVLTLVVVGVYLMTVTTVSALTSRVAGQSSVAVAASTLAAAAMVGPARRRIQSTVDRRFNRARYDAARTAAAYRARLRDELELETITADLVATCGATLQPATSAVWLRPGGRQ